MAAFEIFFFVFLSIFSSFLSNVSANITNCGQENCAAGGPVVRFPFRLTGVQSSRCRYRTGFDLTCNNRSQTLLPLRSGNFTVRGIDYHARSLFINDPDDCLPKRFLNREFEINGPDFFMVDRMVNFTFFNCSTALKMSHQLNPISCLGNGKNDFAVIAVPTTVDGSYPWDQPLDSSSPSPSPSSSSSSSPCSIISTAMVPVPRPFPWPDRFSDLSRDIQLTWTDPDCSDCEDRGGVCGFQIGSATKIGCSVSPIGSNHGMSLSL